MKKEQEMGRKKRKNWRRFCGCCDVFFMPEKQLSVVSMSPSPAESCCPIVILVGGHICPCPAQPCPGQPSMSAVVFGSLLFCVVVVPCALFVCLSSMSTSPRLFLQFSFFFVAQCTLPCVLCVIPRPVFKFNCCGNCTYEPDSARLGQTQIRTWNRSRSRLRMRQIGFSIKMLCPGAEPATHTLAPASTPTCAPFVLGFFNFS